MRRLLIISIASSLLLALVREPLFHRHGSHEHSHDEPEHHNLALLMHTHPDDQGVPDQDDAEAKLNAFQKKQPPQKASLLTFKQESSPSLPVLVGQIAFLSPLVPLRLKVFETPPRGHDPPFVHSSIPRSPPL
jgi:hypothetical protein